MADQARLEETGSGQVPTSEGWFVVNVRDTAWESTGDYGARCRFENRDEVPFEHVGMNIRVLQPGQPNCLYHAESPEEHFLVLYGECLLLVEEEERLLRAWDFVHCPPNTRHVFVGAGVETETNSPKIAYEGREDPRLERPSGWGELPWARLR